MIKVGDKVQRTVHFDKGFSKKMWGTVIYIHPKRMFYLVEFRTEFAVLKESYEFHYKEPPFAAESLARDKKIDTWKGKHYES